MDLEEKMNEFCKVRWNLEPNCNNWKFRGLFVNFKELTETFTNSALEVLDSDFS